MNFFKAVFILLLLSIGASAFVYYVTSGTIKSTWGGIIGEIAFVALPIFLFLFFMYAIARAVGSRIKKRNKKGLPGQEGPKP